MNRYHHKPAELNVLYFWWKMDAITRVAAIDEDLSAIDSYSLSATN